jgi:dTDP-4-dehydrorhamnose 3,5-epimerase
MEKSLLIYDPVFKDNRGTFAPLTLKFKDGNHPYLIKEWLQSNISVNPKKYTLRGLHYQSGEYAQTKLVKVITGNIIDFVVDLRKDSEDYGKCFVYEVNSEYELYVPKGFAHGFITTEDNTVVQYLVDEKYSQPDEGSILWSSVPDIIEGINKYIKYFNEENILISDKDKVCVSLEKYLKNNL